MDRGMERNGPEFRKILADCFGGIESKSSSILLLERKPIVNNLG